MKTKVIIYSSVIIFMFALPIVRYYVSTPGINGCVIDYVDNMDKSNFKWYMYSIDWVRHVEAAWNKWMVNSLTKYKIGKISGCLVASDNYFYDLNNTFYCAVAYMIKKSPMSDDLKKPLWIMKN